MGPKCPSGWLMLSLCGSRPCHSLDLSTLNPISSNQEELHILDKEVASTLAKEAIDVVLL